MRIVFMGSGAFGLPTLQSLAAGHEIVLVVSQPPRPAGRNRVPTPTPVAAWALERDIELFTPERLDAEAVARIAAAEADAQVVIAYGHRIPPELVAAAFSINLHASLLPRWRGAAPINHAMIAGDERTGVSVIELAPRMDAGRVFATRALAIDPRETAGELHDRLAALGPEVVAEVLQDHAAGRAASLASPQDESAATAAPKLAKADGRLEFSRSARTLRQRVHGLTPWPGCTVTIAGTPVKLLRVADEPDSGGARGSGEPGVVLADGRITTGDGMLRPLEVQPAGGRAMSWDEFRRGRRLVGGERVEPA